MEFNLNITFVSPNLELNLHLFDIQFVIIEKRRIRHKNIIMKFHIFILKVSRNLRLQFKYVVLDEP